MNPQRSLLLRLAAALLALTMGGNGVVMLAAGRWWYGAVAGVPETGPFNPHFVKDIGAAYLVVGVAFAWLAARPSPVARGATLAAALFLGLHACVHLAEAVGNPAGLADLARDFPGVFLPALLAVWVAAAYPDQETRHAQSPA
ncbi:MAG TPA: hypothetical protein VN814_07070 [Caulobacteraceae bacterium]|nr:hypothetical protein [Caulobacteraceae bacterium]